MKKVDLLLGLSAAAMMLAAGSAARAQDAPTLEEVVVTAERTETNLQSTAVSVAAFSAETLKQLSVTNLTDLTRVVPGMRYQGQGNIATGDITIRGVNRAPIGTGGPVVVNYFNDVPLSGAIYLPTFDIGSLQVLRGPQGTLFGRNTVGGAILLYPTAPTFEATGYLSANYGNHDYMQVEGALNVPLIDDKMALRLAGQIRQRDGYVENVGIGPDFNDVDTQAFRVSLLMQPTERLRSTTVVDYLKGDEVGWATIAFERNAASPLLFIPGFAASVNQALALGSRATNNNTPNPDFKREVYGIFNTTTFDLTDDLTLKSVLSYRDVYQKFLINNDGLGVPAFEIGSITNGEYYTGELQLIGKSFDERLEWILGGFYAREKPNGVSGTTNTLGILTNGQYLDNKNSAVFGNVRFHLTDRLTLTGGYRYSWDKQYDCSTNRNLQPDECKELASTALPPSGTAQLTAKSSDESWKASIEFQATDDIFLYALVSRGYRFGGISNIFNSSTPCVAGSPLGSYVIAGATIVCSLDVGLAAGGAATGRTIDLRPFQNLKNETVTNYEAGVRADANLGGWPQRLNVTVYHYKYTNLIGSLPLIGLIQPGTPGAPLFDTVGFNAGTVEATGVEADLTLRPVAAFTFNLNVAYTDQEQTELGSGPPSFPVAIPPATLAAPKWAYTASARYILPFRPMDGEMAASVNYFYTGDWATQNTKVEGYDLINARLDWNNIGGGKVSASLWGTNLADEVYLASPTYLGTILPAKSGNFGEPRMYGVELRYAW